ncbi:hypothetical protein Tco_1533290 [Tanacetum coccineum]
MVQPAKTTIVEGVVTVMPITTAEEKAQRRLERNLQQIHPDDNEETDLRCKSHVDYRVKRLLKNTGRKLTVNGNETMAEEANYALMAFLIIQVLTSADYEEIDGGYVAFERNPKGGKVTGKGKAKKSVKLMMEKLFRMELELMLVKTINGEVQLHALVDGKKKTSSRISYEAVHKELGDSLVRAATTASSLEAEQDSGNINKTQSKATPNESSSLGTTSGGGPRCQETMGDTIAQTRIESSDNEESLGEDASKQGRIDAIDTDKEITLVSVQNIDEEMFDVNVLDAELFSDVTTTTATITTIYDINLAQALMEIKNTKPKEKGVVIQELGESTTTISSQKSQDKGKGILIELVKPMKKKDLIRLDEEAALKLQAEFDEEERLAREKAEKEKEANIALIET